MKRFADLTEQEILALAITNEEEDSRIYRGFAEGLREQFPSSAKVFDEMAEEEVHHRTMLFELYRKRHLPSLPRGTYASSVPAIAASPSTPSVLPTASNSAVVCAGTLGGRRFQAWPSRLRKRATSSRRGTS